MKIKNLFTYNNNNSEIIKIKNIKFILLGVLYIKQ